MGLGVLHRCGALAARGYVSTTRWLENEVGLSRPEATGMLARSAALNTDYQATRDALLTGEITTAKARALTQELDTALRGLPLEHLADQRVIAEQILLDLARTATVAEIRRAGKKIRFFLDPDGTTAAALAAYEDQSLALTPTGSMIRIEGWVDAEGGALVLTALDQIIDEWFRTGSLSPEDRLPDGIEPGSAQGRRLRRTRRSHLLALALVELARRQLDNGLLGSRHEVRPHLVLTADLDDIAAGRGGELRIPGHDEPVLLPSVTVGRMLCDAEITAAITRQVTCPSGLPTVGNADVVAWLRAKAHDVLYVGRAMRTISPRLRRALERRDRHCCFPGCRVDPSRTEAHHVTPWEVGGATDVDNLVLLCPRHHHYVHAGGWTITATDLPPTATGCWASRHRDLGPDQQGARLHDCTTVTFRPDRLLWRPVPSHCLGVDLPCTTRRSHGSMPVMRRRAPD
jgi:hypothetical protein